MPVAALGKTGFALCTLEYLSPSIARSYIASLSYEGNILRCPSINANVRCYVTSAAGSFGGITLPQNHSCRQDSVQSVSLSLSMVVLSIGMGPMPAIVELWGYDVQYSSFSSSFDRKTWCPTFDELTLERRQTALPWPTTTSSS